MAAKSSSGTHGPLHGVRILDLTTLLMGPYATLILADLGADIIKVESPEGDLSRQSHPSRSPKMGQSFLNSNRNKRSIVLDLKHADGRAAMLKLAERVDALVYNVRPQAMARLKLSYEDVKAVNPKIIYVGGVGFSQRGRYSGRPAFDDVIQGMAGVPWMAARASGQAPRYTPNAYVDRVSSLHVALAVLAAIHHRDRTGEGQRVDVPMFENIVHLLLNEHLEGETFVPPLGPAGHPRSLSRERRPYKTKDGYLCTLIYNDKQWRSFFKMIGEPQRFEEDARFSNQLNRIKNINAVYGYLSEVLETRSTAEWIKLFMDADIPVGPMNSLDDVLQDPHLAETGYFTPIEHPTEGALRTTYYPTEFSAAPVSGRYPAPRLGEHTRELLAEAGYDSAHIDKLVAQGAAVPAPPPKKNPGTA